ncbi:MAG: SDR family oxidoreductase [Actinomycetota bacterium]|nr:SDR family oxidoreductase [Actinomycetota bacterium]
MRFDDQVVVVTGGASGMGAATARLFAKEGALAFVVDVDASGAEQVASDCKGEALVGDVSDSVFCNQAIARVIDARGQIDVLVNAAGIILRADSASTDDEAWRRMMAVNVDGVFFMSRAALPHMVGRQSGAIVNFGSIWGDVGATGVVAYCAGKGAVHQITRAMALDHATDGVRINAVAPGEVNTPMLTAGRSAPPTPEDLQHLAETTIPMMRLAEPEEVARVVTFLASDEASYITGTVVPVDAGYTAR